LNESLWGASHCAPRRPSHGPRHRRQAMRLLLVGAALAGLAALSSVFVPAVASTATVTPPTYVKTIGGPALPMMGTSGIDVDAAGNLYIADTANDQVASYNAGGAQLWRTGTRGTKANGNFLNPRDVAYANGLLYVADTGNNRLQVLNASTGAWQLTFGHHFSALMGVGVGVDGSGKAIVLAADSTQNQILTFTPSGTLLETIGSAGSGNGQLNQARDATTDAFGNIYVADFKNERVEMFTPAGGFVGAWGTHCPFKGACTTPGQFKDPYGIERDAAGNIYVSDNYRIQEFTGAGTFINQFGQACPQGGCTGNELFQLRRVAVGAGPSPNVYAADLWGYKVVEYDQSGNVVKVFGNVPPAVGGFNDESGLTLFNNTLYVVDTNNQRIQSFNPLTGAYLADWDHRGYGTDLNGVNWPRDITGNGVSNTLWLADTKNFRLLEYRLDGSATGRVIGTTGSKQQPSVLNWTYGLTSWQGDVIAADTFNNRVEAWDGTSSTTPVWTATGMKNPEAVTVSGNTVYVADTNNGRIVELNAQNGATLAVIGSGLFGHPDGIAVAPNGNIWVADSGKNRLTEITPSGALVQNFGKFGTTTNQFNGPAQVVIGPGSGPSTTWLYVADSNNDRVLVFNITNS
jgi:sugar lactone lactonase YvrE